MKANSLLIYFVVANVLLLLAVAGMIIPGRIYTLRMQGAVIGLYERRLAFLEENYRMYGENAAYLAKLQEATGSGTRYAIQPAGQIGALLTEVRRMLHTGRLQSLELYARVQGFQHVNYRHVTEVRVSLSAEGDKDDIISFLHSLSGHYRLLQIDWIQISQETETSKLWVNFTVYEEG